MNEVLEQLIQMIRSAWRFRWWALGVAWLSSIAGWGLVATQKDLYEATARVYVNTASQLRMLLDDQIVEPNVEDQLRLVREALLGRPQLERIARETGLAEGVVGNEAMQMLVDQLAARIQIISGSDLAPPRWGVQRTDDTYTILYHHNERDMAVSVVTKLLNVFVEDTIGGKRTSSQAAGDFLLRQIREYEQRLRFAEEALAAFNQRNFERLPSMQGGYFQRLQTSIEELENARQRLRLAQSRLNSIEQQIRGEVPRAGASGQSDPTSIEARIQENEARLDDLRLRYTENHPDVIAAREIVDQLRARQARELAELQELGGQAPSSNNPVLQALQIARNEVQMEIATLQADVRDREGRVERLRSLLTEGPEVEAELAQLNRDYEVIQAHYRSLLNSLEREKLSREVLESESIDFRIINPPTAGLGPVAPNRTLLLMIVLVGSLGLGAGVAWLLSQIKGVYQDPTSLELATQLPVLGSITRFLTADQRSIHIRSYIQFAGATIGLLIANVVIIGIEVVGPGIRALV
ncbi:MAG: hypothetical protein KF911_11965 [Pseudomonadales bacterium]|nr:hypothetical protein [Pseudomonadales bacterium]